MSAAGWSTKDAVIQAELAHARERRMCLSAQTRTGIELLQRRVKSGALVSPFPHLYEEGHYWHSLDPSEKAIRVIRGVAPLHPDWVFCSTSAAILHGLEVSQPNPGCVHIMTTPQAHTSSTTHVICHAIKGAEITRASGVRVVDVETCVLGCITELDLPHGLAVADSYLRKNKLDPLDLIGQAEELSCRWKRCRALRTARYSDPLAENGGESMSRGTMIELGYAIPELQVELENPVERSQTFRVDFMWRQAVETPIIGELDGMAKYEDPTMLAGRTTLHVLSDERIRESRLTMSGARVMRFRFSDVLDRSRFGHLLDAFGVPRGP